MRMHSVGVGVAVAALVGVLTTGCGGDRLSKREYEQKVRSEYADVQQAFLATGASLGTPDLAEKIADAQEQLREAAEALEGIEPPENVEEENEEIVEGLREYAEDLDGVREAAERSDQQAIDAFNEQISENEAVEQIAEAAEEMKFKGYDLGPIAEE
jgi:phosphoglycolate phosphatase-like HAD superfamily hydrolase